MTQLGASVANDELSKREREIREDIVRRALMGLEDDLDDLRDELGAALEDFEGRIQEHSASLPAWLELDPAEIRAAYRVSAEGLGEATIGPRLVALGAASVEAFIHDWIGRDGELNEAGLEENSEEIGAAREAVLEKLESIELAARDTALDADARLSELLDAILAELDEKREEDAAALRELVGSGDVEKGGGARQEIADLWEEQRARAAELRATWEPLERLIFEGVDYTVEGVGELRGFMERADFALRGGTPEVDHDIDEVSDTIPAPMHDKNEDDEAQPGHLVDSPGRNTEPMETVGATNPYLRKPRRALGEESSASDEEEAESKPKVVDDEPDDTDEVGDTEKMDVRQIEELADAARDEDSEPEEEEGLDESSEVELDQTDGQSIEEDSDAERSDLEEDSDVDDEANLEEESSDADASGESELDEPSDLEEDSDLGEDSDAGGADEDEDASVDSGEPEGVEGEGFRVIARWDSISAVERFWGLGLPMGILVALAIPAALNLLPLSFSVVDPVEIWPWLFPWGFIVIVAWMLIFMILRHWRPLWRGWRMNLTQWREHRESVDISVDARGIRLGGLRYNWHQIDGKEARWESRPDGTFGWMVRFDTRGGETVLAASERNYTRWEQSNLPVDTVPDDVWQVNLVLIQELRKHLNQ